MRPDRSGRMPFFLPHERRATTATKNPNPPFFLSFVTSSRNSPPPPPPSFSGAPKDETTLPARVLRRCQGEPPPGTTYSRLPSLSIAFEHPRDIKEASPRLFLWYIVRFSSFLPNFSSLQLVSMFTGDRRLSGRVSDDRGCRSRL